MRNVFYANTQNDLGQHIHSRIFSRAVFIKPFLSRSRVNMSSDLAVFITYSSALAMRHRELRRRQGTGGTSSWLPAPPRVLLPVSRLLSLVGVHGRIRIRSRRGRMLRRICADPVKRSTATTVNQNPNPTCTQPRATKDYEEPLPKCTCFYEQGYLPS